MELMDPRPSPRRKRKPWVFMFVDHWTSARMRLFGGQALLRMALTELAETYRFHNPPDCEESLIAGVAMIERSLDDADEPRILAAYYGPGDPRNTTIAEEDAPESRAVVRGPWGADSSPLPMAARERNNP